MFKRYLLVLDMQSRNTSIPGDRVQETCGKPVTCMTAGRATPTQEWMAEAVENEKLIWILRNTATLVRVCEGRWGK